MPVSQKNAQEVFCLFVKPNKEEQEIMRQSDP